jgi:hypothetical protein
MTVDRSRKRTRSGGAVIRRSIATSGPALAGERSGRLVQGKKAGIGVSKGTASVNDAEPGTTHLVVTYARQGRARVACDRERNGRGDRRGWWE